MFGGFTSSAETNMRKVLGRGGRYTGIMSRHPRTSRQKNEIEFAAAPPTSAIRSHARTAVARVQEYSVDENAAQRVPVGTKCGIIRKLTEKQHQLARASAAACTLVPRQLFSVNVTG